MNEPLPYRPALASMGCFEGKIYQAGTQLIAAMSSDDVLVAHGEKGHHRTRNNCSPTEPNARHAGTGHPEGNGVAAGGSSAQSASGEKLRRSSPGCGRRPEGLPSGPAP